MRKIVIFTFFLLLAFAACKDDRPQFQISGSVIGELDGKTVYLRQLEEMRPTAVIDSTFIANGTFTLKGEVNNPDLYNILIGGTNAAINLFVENAPIKVSIDAENPRNSIVNGSPLNDLYANYLTELRDNYQTKTQEVSARLKLIRDAQLDSRLADEQSAQFAAEFTKIEADRKAYQLKFVNGNPNSIVSAYVLRTIANYLETSQIEEPLSRFDSVLNKSFYITSVKDDLAKMKKVAIGQKFIDFKMNTPEGKTIAVSDYAGKGKYVLIDFWAAWCGDCRIENPNVVKMYKQYKNKGFEIIGVSLDSDINAWTKAIADDKITWPQMSDLNRWDNEGAVLYHIKSIPSTMLLDKDGTIIAKNIGGEELKAKLADLFDKK